jgi:hypothetical protein
VRLQGKAAERQPPRYLQALRNSSDPWLTQGRFKHCSFEGYRRHFDQCHLLESGDSLRALWSAATLGMAGMSANESVESLGALQSLLGSSEPRKGTKSPFSVSDKTFHVMDRGPRGYSEP